MSEARPERPVSDRTEHDGRRTSGNRMSGRTYAYLDLAALPAVGAALLVRKPDLHLVCRWKTGDLGEWRRRRIFRSPLHGRSARTALFRSFAINRTDCPPGAGPAARRHARLERITLAVGGRLQSLAASCQRIVLPDGAAAVLIAFEPARGDRTALADRAARLAQMITADGCVVAVLDRSGSVVASQGDIDDSDAADAAIDELIAAVDRAPGRVIKRTIRIGLDRRPAGMLRFQAEGASYHLLIAGPAERIVAEQPSVTARRGTAAGSAGRSAGEYHSRRAPN